MKHQREALPPGSMVRFKKDQHREPNHRFITLEAFLIWCAAHPTTLAFGLENPTIAPVPRSK